MGRNISELSVGLKMETGDLLKGVDKTTQAINNLNKTTQQSTQTLANVAKGIYAFEKGADFVQNMSKAIVDNAFKFAEQNKQMQIFSQNTGMSASSLSSLDKTFTQSGSSLANFTGMMSKVNDLYKNTIMSSNQTSDVFKKLGISLNDNLDGDEIFSKMMTGLDKIENKSLKAYYASQLLGDGYKEFLRIADKIEEKGGLSNIRNSQIQSGSYNTQVDQGSFGRLSEASAELKETFDLLSKKMASSISPILSNIIEKLNQMDFTKVAELAVAPVKYVLKIIERINFSELDSQLNGAIEALKLFASYLLGSRIRSKYNNAMGGIEGTGTVGVISSGKGGVINIEKIEQKYETMNDKIAKRLDGIVTTDTRSGGGGGMLSMMGKGGAFDQIMASAQEIKANEAAKAQEIKTLKDSTSATTRFTNSLKGVGVSLMGFASGIKSLGVGMIAMQGISMILENFPSILGGLDFVISNISNKIKDLWEASTGGKSKRAADKSLDKQTDAIYRRDMMDASGNVDKEIKAEMRKLSAKFRNQLMTGEEYFDAMRSIFQNNKESLSQATRSNINNKLGAGASLDLNKSFSEMDNRSKTYLQELANTINTISQGTSKVSINERMYNNALKLINEEQETSFKKLKERLDIFKSALKGSGTDGIVSDFKNSFKGIYDELTKKNNEIANTEKKRLEEVAKFNQSPKSEEQKKLEDEANKKDLKTKEYEKYYKQYNIPYNPESSDKDTIDIVKSLGNGLTSLVETAVPYINKYAENKDAGEKGKKMWEDYQTQLALMKKYNEEKVKTLEYFGVEEDSITRVNRQYKEMGELQKVDPSLFSSMDLLKIQKKNGDQIIDQISKETDLQQEYNSELGRMVDIYNLSLDKADGKTEIQDSMYFDFIKNIKAKLGVENQTPVDNILERMHLQMETGVATIQSYKKEMLALYDLIGVQVDPFDSMATSLTYLNEAFAKGGIDAQTYFRGIKQSREKLDDEFGDLSPQQKAIREYSKKQESIEYLKQTGSISNREYTGYTNILANKTAKEMGAENLEKMKDLQPGGSKYKEIYDAFHNTGESKVTTQGQKMQGRLLFGAGSRNNNLMSQTIEQQTMQLQTNQLTVLGNIYQVLNDIRMRGGNRPNIMEYAV